MQRHLPQVNHDALLPSHPASTLVMAHPDHASVLELNCLVLGDDTSHIFTVKIPDNDNVSALKKAIWTQKTPEFNHVAADKLVIWQVSFPDDDNLPQMLDELNFVESNALRRASTKLSKVFPTRPEDEHLHILIQRPPTCEPYLINHITNF
jgi:hypothetical protein